MRSNLTAVRLTAGAGPSIAPFDQFLLARLWLLELALCELQQLVLLHQQRQQV